MALISERIMDIERGSIRSHSMEKSFWKRLWTCLKTGYGPVARQTTKWITFWTRKFYSRYVGNISAKCKDKDAVTCLSNDLHELCHKFRPWVIGCILEVLA